MFSKRRSFAEILVMAVILLLVCTLRPKAATSPATVTMKSISAPAYNKVVVNWNPAKGATHYMIYYRKNGTSKWIKLATVNSSVNSYSHIAKSGMPITVGQKYFYTVKAYNSSTKLYGSYNKTGLSVTTKPNKVELVQVKPNTARSALILSWKKASGCNYYRIYRKSASSSSWAKIASVKSSVLQYTDKKITKNTKYTYTVRGYYSVNNIMGNYNTKGLTCSTDHTHTYVGIVTKSATCVATGVKEYICPCGASYTKTLSISKSAHQWTDHKATREVEKTISHSAEIQEINHKEEIALRWCCSCKAIFANRTEAREHESANDILLHSTSFKQVTIPAYTERVIIREAYDETVLVQEKYVDYVYCKLCKIKK